MTRCTENHEDPQHSLRRSLDHLYAYQGPTQGVMDDATAERYVENYGDDPTNYVTVEVAGLRSDDIVLDVGCGSGLAVREAAARLRRGRAIGVDPSWAMLRIAAELSASHAQRARMVLLEGVASHLPLKGDSVTVTWAINSLHHWSDPARGLSEVLRVLAPEGRFLVTEDEHDEGRFGHSDGPLSDATFVMGALEETGFVEVDISRRSVDECGILIISWRRPED
jgi:SAM-dependent methyltransferase